MSFQIAIDGPVSAGKGTVSRLVADRLGLLYVDTGAMYRAVAFKALENHVSWDDEADLVKLIQDTKIELERPTAKTADGRLVTVLLDRQDVSWQIRTEKIGQGASVVSTHKLVRQALVKIQQQIAQGQDVVMEGRDITSVVLPKANFKIYLTASPVVRAKRRHLDQLTKGHDMTYDEIYHNLVKRDKDDTQRQASPLLIVPGAWVIDSSDYSIMQVVDLIVDKAKIIRSQIR
ncbi:MAG: (d)CMP kinase [Patescibacteria group bacterium]|nr:(d)CMP kinase [Patescibacteria group bacterium]